jgi:3-hexulose-6-phosphate synthase
MLLQLAIDAPEHLSVVPGLADLVHIVEVGTPLLKRFGLSAISTVAELAPNVPVLADTKTVDGGRLEAEMVFGAGASMMTVLSTASPATHEAVARVARHCGAHVVVDTIAATGLPDAPDLFPPEFAYLALHASTDVRLTGMRQTAHIDATSSMRKLGYRVSLAGGINRQNFPSAVDAAPDIVVVGSAITEAENPREVVKWMVAHLSAPGRGWPSDPR